MAQPVKVLTFLDFLSFCVVAQAVGTYARSTQGGLRKTSDLHETCQCSTLFAEVRERSFVDLRESEPLYKLRNLFRATQTQGLR